MDTKILQQLDADLYYCDNCKCLSKNVKAVYKKEQEEEYTKAMKRYTEERKKHFALENFVSKELVGIIQEAIKLKLLWNSIDDIRDFLLLNYPEHSEDIWVDSGARGWFSWKIRFRRWIGLSYPYPMGPSLGDNYSITCPICLHKKTFWRQPKWEI